MIFKLLALLCVTLQICSASPDKVYVQVDEEYACEVLQVGLRKVSVCFKKFIYTDNSENDDHPFVELAKSSFTYNDQNCFFQRNQIKNICIRKVSVNEAKGLAKGEEHYKIGLEVPI